MSEEAGEFFVNMKKGMMGSINTCSLCKIVSYDPATMKADVETIPAGDLILSVPVSAPQTKDFIIRVPYKPGNIGFVVYSQSQIDGALTGGIGEESDRQFAIDDAIFVGGINLFTETMDADHADDLIISKKDFTSKIVMKSDGDVVIHTDGNVLLGSEDATEGVPLGDQLKEWLDTHTHPISWTDPGGSGHSGSPTGASPSPSERVKTI